MFSTCFTTVNTGLLEKGLERLDDFLRPAIMSGLLSDMLSASLAKHSRTLVQNRYFNGHPDLLVWELQQLRQLLDRPLLEAFREDLLRLPDGRVLQRLGVGDAEDPALARWIPPADRFIVVQHKQDV